MKHNKSTLVKLFHFASPVLMGLLISNSSTAAPNLRFCDTGFQFKLAQGPKVKHSELNIEKSMETLTKVSKELQVLLEADKDNLLPLVLKLISGNDPNALISSDDTYAKILFKIQESLRKLNSKVSFEAQLSILPQELCSHLDEKVGQRLEKIRNKTSVNELNRVDHVIQSIIDNAPNIVGSRDHYSTYSNPRTDFLWRGFRINWDKIKEIYQSLRGGSHHNQDENISFSTNTYNHSNENQKNFELVGMSLNISYKADAIKTTSISSTIPYEASLYGGFLISAPHNFQYKLDLPIALNGSPVGNLNLNHAHFENDPQYPAVKNYVALTFENIKYSNKAMNSIDMKNYLGTGPKMHLYFSDEFFFNYNLITKQISLTPSLENPLKSLLINVTTDGCPSCSKYAKLNLPINHIVLDFEEFDIFTENPTTKERTHMGQAMVPMIRLPLHKKGEAGGIKFSLRADGLIEKNKIDVLSFYLNGDSIINDFIGGRSLAEQGINAGYDYLLKQVAIDASFFREFMKQSTAEQQQPTTSSPTMTMTSEPTPTKGMQE